MIKQIAKKLTDDVIEYTACEYKRVQRLEVPFINGHYDESTIQEYLDLALVMCGSLSILAEQGNETGLNTIKNHHFFTRHLWIAPEYFNKVGQPVYLNAHHDLDKPVLVLDVVRVGGALLAILENGNKHQLTVAPYGSAEELNVNGTLGIPFTFLADPTLYYQYNPAFSCFKQPESGRQGDDVEVIKL